MELRSKKYKGGRRVRLSIMEMEQLFGASVSAQIIKYLGGCVVYIPSGRKLQAAHMKREVGKLRAAGMKRKDIRAAYPHISPQLLSYYLNGKKGKAK